jgi:hypothetical protein
MDWNALLQGVLEMLLNALLPVVLGYVVLFIRKQMMKVEADIEAGEALLNMRQYEIAKEFARQVVLASEQSGLTGEIDDIGRVKKEYAMSRLDSLLAEIGISLDLEALSDLIEAAVYEAFKDLKEGG